MRGCRRSTTRDNDNGADVQAAAYRHRKLALSGSGRINYTAGLTAMRTRDDMLGTSLGMIPRHHRLRRSGRLRHRTRTWPFIVMILALVALSTRGRAAAHRRRRRRAQRSALARRCGARRGGRMLSARGDQR